MTSSTFVASWQDAARLLSEAGTDRGVHQVFPDLTVRLSLIAATASEEVAVKHAEHQHGRDLSQRLKALAGQLEAIQLVGSCPIVGVAGLLNSGKSSLIATYLSPRGRERVLRGTANNQGTHRFVLWLPSAWWRNDEVLAGVTAHLTELFGVPPETLAEDTETAFRQYNGEVLDPGLRSIANEKNSDTQEKNAPFPNDRASGKNGSEYDPLSIPLVGHDEALNDLGMGLLDCPDIQTAFWNPNAEFESGLSTSLDAEGLQKRRRDHLFRVGRLCSAFVVVSKFGSLGEQRLQDLLETLNETMPGVPRVLAVNKVKARYAPEVVLMEARSLVERFSVSEVYIAYDYRSHWASQRVPEPPKSMPSDTSEPMPIFFKPELAAIGKFPAGLGEVTVQNESNMPRAVVSHYLHHLGELLKPSTLVVEGRRSILAQLEARTADATQWISVCCRSRESQLQHAWSTIADACFEFMADRDSSDRTVGIRLQTSPAIIAQMSDSLCRAAPWPMKIGLTVDRSVRSLQNTIADGAKRFTWLRSATNGLSHFMNRFRHGQTGRVVNAERFAAQLERCDHHGALDVVKPAQLQLICEEALARFQAEDTVRLDTESLDRWSVETWKHMPVKRKLVVGTVPLAPIFGPLLAVTLIPFDGGGTAVLVFATTKELLAAAGIAALATPLVGGRQAMDIAEEEAALGQLSELFAITCDALGVPRPNASQLPKISIHGQNRQLSACALSPKKPATANWFSLWKLAPDFVQVWSNQVSLLRRDLESVGAP